MKTLRHGLFSLWIAVALLAAPPAVRGQTVIYDVDTPAPLSREVLEQLVAPIALYSDALLAQILMASTYPIEVVQADYWLKRHQHLSGEALVVALEAEAWDPSVKSLINFPQVLGMLNDNLGWTTELGDAFLADQEGVMAAVQRLRARAHAEGNLQTTEQQRVVVEAGGSSSSQTVIVIESVKKEVIYVPVYDPLVVYGPWPYPAYRPIYYRPPGFVATAAISFGSGFYFGAAWGYAWGGCDWRHYHVDIDFHRHTHVHYSHRINRAHYHRDYYHGNRSAWRHEPHHRRGVAYRYESSARRYNGKTAHEAVRSREPYRGRTDWGNRDVTRSDRDRFSGRQPSMRPVDRSATRQRSATDERPSTRERSATRPDARPDAGGRERADRSQRGTPSARPSGPFSGADSGKSARAYSERGQASRSGGAKPRSSGSSSSRFSRPDGADSKGGRRGP